MAPVLTALPSIKVKCPTRTPSTSVIALRGPGRRMPGAIPRSLALGRSVSGFVMVSSRLVTPSVEKVLAAAHKSESGSRHAVKTLRR